MSSGEPVRLAADFIAGCDGFHGVSRHAVPPDQRRDHRHTLPMSWLGVLSATPPVHGELVYAASDRGFALCSMRNEGLSRYYIQCANPDTVADWPDDAFWRELRLRIPADLAASLVTGPSLDKSVIPLRSFVTEPMRWGRLFLCGDAAHIFPPTGAKGLNAAALDVADLAAGLHRFYREGRSDLLDSYSKTALARIWKMQRFSLWFTRLLHRYPDAADTGRDGLAALRADPQARKAFAEAYVGVRR